MELKVLEHRTAWAPLRVEVKVQVTSEKAGNVQVTLEPPWGHSESWRKQFPMDRTVPVNEPADLSFDMPFIAWRYLGENSPWDEPWFTMKRKNWELDCRLLLYDGHENLVATSDALKFICPPMPAELQALFGPDPFAEEKEAKEESAPARRKRKRGTPKIGRYTRRRT